MRGIRSGRILALALIGLVAMAWTATAQVTTGSVAGTVKDAQGLVIPGATVTLTSETRGTKTQPVVTTSTGQFQFVNVTADTYTLSVEMPSFTTLQQKSVTVAAGTPTNLGTLTLQVGSQSTVVDVKSEAPVIQATTGERSFTIATESVTNLPISNRSFTALASLAPGVNSSGDPARLGGGGATNIMMDGISTMDTGSNRILLQMNVESIAEVKVLTSNYQAEFGRSSGLQVTAVTKSGSNRFHGSLYDVERNSKWNANSKTNKLNGDPKNVSADRDWGYSIGGPVGKPGGNNKLFFFYSQEFEPRKSGNDTTRVRFPTADERNGDFSKTLDQNGALYPYIKDPRLSGLCTAADTSACFADGGVLGKIPQDMLYGIGLNILRMYPMPTIANADVPAGQSYNFIITRPVEKALSWQPALRVDYQPMTSLRTTFKWSGWQQRNQTFNGSVPGYNDTRMQNPVVSTWATSVNYTLNQTTFLEGTFGHSQNELAGCALAQSSTGPSFCTSGLPMGEKANLNNVGLADLPLLFPDATIINPNYYAYSALNAMSPKSSVWDGTRAARVPSFSWGNRIGNAPPNQSWPGYFNINATYDISVSMTKVSGHHTLKTGYYHTHSYKAENPATTAFGSISFQQDTVGTNPFDTSFGYANAAIGSFSSINQASKYVEGNYVYYNAEVFVQDNWKVNRRLTLDYGMRFVHQDPQYDNLGQAANFFVDKWTIANAPRLYVNGCANGVYPCSSGAAAAQKQAMDPLTGTFLGPNSSLAVGTLIPGTGDELNGLILPGTNGISKTGYVWPTIAAEPRFGAAYDLSGSQTFVLRGGAGLFFDRPSGNSVISTATNPPTSKTVTVRYGQLQALGKGGLSTQGPPTLQTFVYDAKIPSDIQWNGGVQMALPWSVSLDVEYVGHHSFNAVQAVNLNGIDLGATFLDKNQDPTLNPSATPGALARSNDLIRALPGYASINQNQTVQWETYHSIQVSFQRRFRNGLQFGFNDTMGLHDERSLGPRLQHNADGTFFVRSDQQTAQDLLGGQNPNAHLLKANFVWDLPDIKSDKSLYRAIGLAVNDWQLSGIWSGSTGGAYAVSASYSSGGGSANLTGSGDFGARIRIVGDPGKGCNTKDLYHQFNTSAFQGPLVGSTGLESGNGYLHGCFSSVLDLAVARTIRLGGGRQVQLRVDMYNAPNQGRITGRNTSLSMTNPSDPITINNLPYDPATGLLVPGRVGPDGAGAGVVSGYQGPRTVQGIVRFQF